jgi:UDP-N-acetylmuramate: L-alanyl-gamma-D-glutamyl-meso-diaminopimelate ligase
VRDAGVNALAVADGAAALEALGGAIKGEEVLLLLSSGPLDGLAETAPAMLETRFS